MLALASVLSNSRVSERLRETEQCSFGAPQGAPFSSPGKIDIMTTDDTLRTARRWRIYSFGLLAFGWLTSGYLLLRMATMGFAHLRWDPRISAGSLCTGCDEALANASSWTHGIPLPGIGLVYFAIIGLLLVWGGNWASRPAFLVAAAGAGASLVL